MGKVNRCLKGISLESILRNFLCEKRKVIDFFNNFLYFNKSDIKTFLKSSINKCPKGPDPKIISMG